jgi:glycerol 3-phosphatase-2
VTRMANEPPPAKLPPPMPFDFSKFQAVLLDLDGTICYEDEPLPGAIALLRRLLADGKIVGCPTNSTQSPARLVTRLSAMGVGLPAERIFTAAQAAVEYCLKQFGPRPRIFNLATEGVADMLQARADQVDSANEACDAVIIGNPQCVWATRPRMSAAVQLLRKGAACVGICDDRVYPSPRGLEIGSGATTRMLAYAGNCQPLFFGKPQTIFFENACRKLNAEPGKCILVGDNLESDIAGAKGVGMATILSLTGVARRKDVEALPSHLRPDWIVENLTEL